MTLITKPDFTYVWASGGAVVAPNDSKKQLGWVAEAPPFQYDNWLQNRQDQMLAHINQRGIPAWDGATNYEAASLSYVQGGDGKVYKSVAASGPSTTVQDPTTDVTDTYWTVAFADVGSFLTQAAGDTRYAQRSNNLSDLTNASTARTNLGVITSTDTTEGLIELATQAEVNARTDSQRAVVPLTLGDGIVFSNGVVSYRKTAPWQDGGTIHAQGTATTTGTSRIVITLPLAFADLNYVITVTSQSPTNAFPGWATEVNRGYRTTSTFEVGTFTSGAAAAPSVQFQWTAEGKAP